MADCDHLLYRSQRPTYTKARTRHFCYANPKLRKPSNFPQQCVLTTDGGKVLWTIASFVTLLRYLPTIHSHHLPKKSDISRERENNNHRHYYLILLSSLISPTTMCVLQLRGYTPASVGLTQCQIASKILDDSSATAKTTDSADEGDEVPMTRPPIVIGEDDQSEETFYQRDSIDVERLHKSKVNDEELHEKSSHLEDHLIPRHFVRVVRPDEAEVTREDVVAHDDLAKMILNEAASSDADAPQDRLQLKVRFGSVLRRDYDIILGDNPSCLSGVPLTISWDYTEYEPLDVDEYEFSRPPRRSMLEMQLNYCQRVSLLKDAGFTMVAINHNLKKVNREKRNRSLTSFVATNYPLMEDVEAVMERAYRKFKRLFKKDKGRARNMCLSQVE